MRNHLILTIVIILLTCGISVAAPNLKPISNKDRVILKNAISAIDRKKFDQADLESRQASDQIVKKLIKWMLYQENYEGNSYEEIASFIKNNPDWPMARVLKNRAESTLTNTTPAVEIVKYFKDGEPITGNAMRLLAEAKITLNSKDNATINRLIRTGWIQGDFSREDEDGILKNHAKRLRTEDHQRRIDRLLWEGKTNDAKSLLGLVDENHKRLAWGRIMLQTNRHGADSAIKKVPESLYNDPGFLYDRIKWQEKRNNYHAVAGLLKAAKKNMPYQDKWWKIKSSLARELIKQKKYKEAYEVVKYHGNTPGGEDFAESEWLAGWLALSFLHSPRAAYEHFYKLFDSVNFPVSKARGAYWAGRAAEANENSDIARKWYRIAAKNPTTFYGQLAFLKIGGEKSIQIPNTPEASYNDIEKYNRNDLVKAAYALSGIGKYDMVKKFITAAVSSAETPGEISLIADFGHKIGRKEISVTAAKGALNKGIILSKAGWPVLKNVPDSDVEAPLVLGLIRQESSFDPEARSPANAMGLMQLIPPTAKRTAHQMNLGYSQHKLTGDPEYNMKLGSHYLNHVMSRLDGSYVLAIAAYNAGPTNVNRWLETYGDPRKASDPEEVLTWMESIPFKETRSYVQRVLENTQVYRYLTNGESFALHNDLMRVETKLSSESH